MKKILCIFGTRPEAIKLAPLIKLLKVHSTVQVRVCVTAQQRQMLDQVLELFDIVPDIDLNIMKPDQNLVGVTSEVLTRLQTVYQEERPDWVVVHGDTTTTFAATLCAFYEKIPVAHVEAGLRTHNFYAPWPEEMNRSFTGKLAQLHFAPTSKSRLNLISEGIDPSTIYVTGNTVIDALFETTAKLHDNHLLCNTIKSTLPQLDPTKKLLLMTGHRRENFGGGFERICHAVREVADRTDLQIIYPVHLNPNVQDPVKRLLCNHPNIFLIEPLDYLPFVYLIQESYLILTDSGGIQEEAPSLGKPVLVMRDATERPEAVEAGTVILVGTDKDKIVKNVNWLLDDPESYAGFTRIHNPYGDGQAAERIARILLQHCGVATSLLQPFTYEETAESLAVELS